MATLNICSRLCSPETKRFQINIKDLEQQVHTVIEEINKNIQTDENSFDIIYAGQKLKPDDVLSKLPVHNLSTLYVVKKFTLKRQTKTKKEGVPKPSKNEVTMAMQSALLNMEYRNVVQKMLSDPDSVENIIATTHGLDDDPTVLAMLQEPELAAVLSHPQNLSSLLELHPSFAQAAVTIATAVNEESTKSGRTGATGGLSYSLDQMSDEDEEMPEPSRRQGSRGTNQSITASQLAAALQAAAGAFAPTSSGASTSQQTAPSTSAGPITTDFFQQAMAHAQTASNDGALQQLRDMGITDENVARQALTATGGDIQAAIELIFSDGML